VSCEGKGAVVPLLLLLEELEDELEEEVEEELELELELELDTDPELELDPELDADAVLDPELDPVPLLALDFLLDPELDPVPLLVPETEPVTQRPSGEQLKPSGQAGAVSLQRSAPESKESTQAPRNIEAAAATMIFESFIRLPDKGSHADPGDGKDARHDLDDLPGARRALCVRDG
jgi:hypothetical protein